MKPDYPVYVVSKGRPDTRLTARALEAMGVDFVMVVEEDEREQYAAAVGRSRVVVLEPSYRRDYDPCDDLGESKSKGPGPARNFVWDHASRAGAAWHWVLDDNIRRFYRWNRKEKIAVLDGAIFRAMEAFCERYENVAMAGPCYERFAPITAPTPFTLNTRIYSCNLIRTDAPFRWRGRYNEDTDLSLRMLKAGWCTVEFNAFLQDKTTTQVLRGGNTDEFYIREGTLAKSQTQVRLHPDVSRLVWRFNRWHHAVDYRPFKRNALKRKPGLSLSPEPNEYGMKLVQVA